MITDEDNPKKELKIVKCAEKKRVSLHFRGHDLWNLSGNEII